jgi:hypothetical protein
MKYVSFKFTFMLGYRQIWLLILMDACQLSNITKLKKQKNTCRQAVFLLGILNCSLSDNHP